MVIEPMENTTDHLTSITRDDYNPNSTLTSSRPNFSSTPTVRDNTTAQTRRKITIKSKNRPTYRRNRIIPLLRKTTTPPIKNLSVISMEEFLLRVSAINLNN